MKTKQRSMQEQWQDSYLSGGNDAYLENLYETYLKTPRDVTPEWQNYFDKLAESGNDVSHEEIRNYFARLAREPARRTVISSAAAHDQQQEKIVDLITAYRSFGHLRANIDPLGMWNGRSNATLDLNHFGEL